MKRFRQPTHVVLGSPAWVRSIARGCDHVHWSIINGEKLDPDMGTTSDPTPDGKTNTGLIVLCGRRSDGYHHTLYGPITAEQYRAIQITKNLPPS